MSETKWNAKFKQEAEEIESIWAKIFKNGVFDYNSIRASNSQQMVGRSIRTSDQIDSLEKSKKYRSLDDPSEIEHE